jgi:short-subunit dehydrogenase
MLAVVTGASSGIGQELARAFERHGFDVREVSEQDYDLATPEGVEALYASFDAPIDVLALNAGISVGGAFATGDLDEHLRLVDLDVRGVVHLAGLVSADMVARGSGRLLFTSSVVAAMPGPYQATYNASKSFVQSFALALRDELSGSGVSVTILMPGPTDTHIFARAGQQDTLLAAVVPKADPATVAEQAYEAVMAGRERVVSGGFPNRVIAAGSRLLPDAVKGRLNRIVSRPGSAP